MKRKQRVLTGILVFLVLLYTCMYKTYKISDKRQPRSDQKICESDLQQTKLPLPKANQNFVLKDGPYPQSDKDENYFKYKSKVTGLSGFLGRQAATRSYLTQYCNQYTKELPRFEEGFSSIVLDSVNKITYCPIYKIASTSWALILLHLRGKSLTNDLGKVEAVRDAMDRVFKKVPHKEGPQKTQSTDKFMIVRHPFERLISAYRDKFEGAKKYYFYNVLGKKMVRKFRPLPPGKTEIEIDKMLYTAERAIIKHNESKLQNNPYSDPYGPTFVEFIKYVVSLELPDDDHWRPIYIQCSLCFMEYDFVLRFENLECDSKSFIKYLNKSQTISPRWDNPTAGGKTTEDLACTYFGQLTSDLGKALLDKYIHDLNMFNYSPDEYLNCIYM